MARDTKLGPEEITRDIPNVSEETLKNLDEAGIVYIGAEVRAGDILVGKITPKGESPMTPEEKLLRAIFGEKASDVRDTSLRVPPGVQGTVVEVRVFNRHGVEKDERALAIEREEIERLAKDRDDEQAILDRNVYGRLAELLEGRQGIAGPKGFKKDTKITRAVLEEYPRSQWWMFASPNDKIMAEIEAIRKQYDESKKRLEQRFLDKVEKLQRGDELPPGVMKMVKVFVAVKRKIQPGDKMAGRHGNKGVVSKIVPSEDMPFLADGTPVDVVLNPLGVPSRMNVGQILETHLGWACAGMGLKIGAAVDLYNSKKDSKPLKELLRKIYGEEETIKSLDEKGLQELGTNLRHGVPIATPVFDGAKEADIENMLDLAGLDHSGQVSLYDGRTGDTFDRKVTVGYIYMLKLHHLVDDKIHARSLPLTPTSSYVVHLYAEATSPRRRQDPCPVDRPVQPRHPATARRQGAVRRSAVRRNGGVGARSLRRRLHAAGNADGEIRRRGRTHQGLRIHRTWRRRVRVRHSGIVQRAGQGNALARIERRPAQFQATARRRRQQHARGGRVDIASPVPGEVASETSG